MSSSHRGVLYILLSGMFFGLLGYFGLSLMNHNFSVYSMLFWRFAVAFVFLLIVIVFKKPSRSSNWIDLVKVFMYGALFYSTVSIFYYLSAVYIGSGLAMVIFFTYPAMVMIGNQIFYKKPFQLSYLLAILIIFLGMLFLIQGSAYHFVPIGIVYSLLSALLFTFYLLFSKTSTVPAVPSTLMLSLGCMFTCLLGMMWEHAFPLPSQLPDWLDVLGIGIICTALPIFLLLEGLTHISATQASILSVLEPVFVVIFGILLLHEQVSFSQLVGVVIVLSGSLISLISDNSDG
ncbi:DMT family transporter [Legionella sp. W05-934-2]|uniref:DMT family transporter n=1 Tax=Legionella sp. W05-934-2 TaxID=1198649 RepID=UPI003462A88E